MPNTVIVDIGLAKITLQGNSTKKYRYQTVFHSGPNTGRIEDDTAVLRVIAINEMFNFGKKPFTVLASVLFIKGLDYSKVFALITFLLVYLIINVIKPIRTN